VEVEVGGAPAATLDGEALALGSLSCDGLLLQGEDVVGRLLAIREKPVLPGGVSEASIAGGALDPSAVFDPATGPLDAPRGGTGIGSAAEGALLVGGGAGPATESSAAFSGGVLTAPSLAAGPWVLEAAEGATGRRTLFARDRATGASVDLLAAGRRALPPPSLSLEPGHGGQVTARAVAGDALARVVHFVWRTAPSGDLAPAEVARLPSVSVRVDPGGEARWTATGLQPGVALDFRAASEDGRGNVGAVASASGAPLS